jgi:hypothetical protein
VTTPAPTTASILAELQRERLYDLARVFGFRLQPTRDTRLRVARLLATRLGEDRLTAVLRELGRDELRAVCRAHGLAADETSRELLIARLCEAAGFDPRAGIEESTRFQRAGLPRVGQVLAARGRQWLVERVDVPEGAASDSPVLHLACLDDDAPGRELAILWDLEIGARVVAPEAEGLGTPGALDPPAYFGAYLHAIKWSAVSAADATRFQAPFRAGIKIMPHQLTPLMKALELPRANLFIADDVGLGKTIEAGLVLQELILRQQAEFVLIVCPASITLQWRDEMMRRFGLRFEVMTRQWIARRRVERGFGINPWATHNRFIISHPLIRRPEYLEPLHTHLGVRARKGLLILDEAHVAAPASASKYAVDSDTTDTMRGLAPKFDNRLFLSATPHNGHSNSFTALLEILDPARFTRAVPIESPDVLAAVMVRRLKRDLRKLGVERFPERVLVQIELEHGPGGFRATESRQRAESPTAEPPSTLAADLGGEPIELELSRLLARYTELCAPGKGRGQLVFVNLQKRLLSSLEAFARTLEVHAHAVDRVGGVTVVAASRPPVAASRPPVAASRPPVAASRPPVAASRPPVAASRPPDAATQPADAEATAALDPETYGEDDEARANEDDVEIADATRALPTPTEEAAQSLARMRALAERGRRQPDGKVRALLAWLRAHCCPAIGLAPELPESRAWSERRVILFTEYADTKRYLQEILAAAIAHTERGDERILTFHGGMGDDARDVVQRAFNASPAEHPVRILLATDAAREGVNLQAHCADLFHLDVPWNPSRLEQRNGRIDRTLQTSPEVRCHYFTYTQRDEDRVLETLVRKLATVQRELGSVGAVLMDEMERTLGGGITQATRARLDAIGDDARRRTADAELESPRKQLDALEADVHRAARRLDASRRALEVEPKALRGVVEIGLRLAGADGLTEASPTSDKRATFLLPALDRSWEPTLDTLRPPRGRGEPFWEWRRRAPRAVTFDPVETLSEDAEQLHLAHPLVRRILDRFLAQGYGAHDLSRVCAVVVPGENVARTLAYARLTLFGRGAARLHDELIAVVAPWTPGTAADAEPAAIAPYRDVATATRAREATERALASGARAPSKAITDRLLASAPTLFAALWPHLEAESDARATDARNGLARRARKESDDLKALLERQRTAVRSAHGKLSQRALDEEITDRIQRRQIELDLEHLVLREERLAQEIGDEPLAIEALYEVQMTRLVPVGLVIAWPEAMT